MKSLWESRAITKSYSDNFYFVRRQISKFEVSHLLITRMGRDKHLLNLFDGISSQEYHINFQWPTLADADVNIQRFGT